MDWKSVAVEVSKAAPILGGLVGGPLGAAGGSIVTKLVSTALGVPETPDDVSAALTNDPDAYVKLKTAEMDNKVQLQQLAVTQEQNRLAAQTAQYAAEAADRDSARKLAAAVPTDHTRQILTYMMMVMIAGILIAIFSGFATSLLRDSVISLTIGTVLGYMFNELKQMLSFWFGSTKDQSATTSAVTQFAVTPGTVTQEQK